MAVFYLQYKTVKIGKCPFIEIFKSRLVKVWDNHKYSTKMLQPHPPQENTSDNNNNQQTSLQTE